MRTLHHLFSSRSSPTWTASAEWPTEDGNGGSAIGWRSDPDPARPGPALTAEFCTRPPHDDEWRAIANGLAPQGRFATAAWIRAWGDNCLPYQNWRAPLRYLTVRAGEGRLQAVFPIARQTKFGVSVDALAGYYWPFRTPIIPEPSADACEALAAALTRRRSTLALRYGPVPDTLLGVAALNRALERQGWRIHRTTLGETVSVVLPGSWQQFEDRLGKSLRKKTKYYERKMRREGALEIQRRTGSTGASWSETVRDLGSIEAKSWQGRSGGRPRFFGEANQAFWTTLLADPSFASIASVWLMYFNGEPVSFCFCLDCGDTRHIVANHYAERVQGYSTGSVLYRHVFRDAVESGALQHVNIGLGDAGYKSRWGAHPSFQLVDWIAFRPGVRGRLLDWASRLRWSIQGMMATYRKTAPNDA